VKLSEGSRRTRFFQYKFASFGFLRQAARGEAFRRKPKDARFSIQVRFLRLPSASFGKPAEVKLPEGRSESRRKRNKFPSLGRTHVLRLPSERESSYLLIFCCALDRAAEGVLNLIVYAGDPGNQPLPSHADVTVRLVLSRSCSS